MSKKQHEREIAKGLYITGNVTQKDIATLTRVSEATVSKWVKEGEWDALRTSQLVTRKQLLQDAYLQLKALNDKIFENGGVPSKTQSDSKNGLIKEIEVFSNRPLHQYIEVFEDFLQWLNSSNPKIVLQFTEVSMKYLEKIQAEQK